VVSKHTTPPPLRARCQNPLEARARSRHVSRNPTAITLDENSPDSETALALSEPEFGKCFVTYRARERPQSLLNGIGGDKAENKMTPTRLRLLSRSLIFRSQRSKVSSGLTWSERAARLLPLVTALISGCVTVDHNTAAALGTAGVQATQVLSTQAAGAIGTLGQLNQWWGVHDTLVCVSTPTTDTQRACLAGVHPTPQPSTTQIVDVLNKSKQAIDTLNQAYSAFVDLAHYNAGQQATATLQSSFTDINSFLSAVSALPGAAALAPISTTVEKAAAGIIGLAADSKQNAEILAANKDLQNANDALYGGLSSESKALTSILQTLQSEREALYNSGCDAGLIDPTDILTPIFVQAYPGLRLQKPPEKDRDVVKAAAKFVIAFQDQQINAAISSTYVASLSTLHALSAQHEKLAAKQSLNLGEVQTEVSNLKADIAQISNSAPPSSAK
jgi:hypothetical protein